MNGAFWKAGHPPTLVATFLYFDLSFMVWVMLGPLAVQISQQLGLTPTQKGLMVAVPVLAGALLRIVMGVLVDHLKPKRAGSLGQVVVIAGLFWAWYIGVRTYADVLALGLVLGVAGAYGWNNVFGLALIPLCIAFALYLALAKDSPHCPPSRPLRDYLKVLKDRDAWWLMFFYGVTVGGFVGLASSLTLYFNDQYGLSPLVAYHFNDACVFAGSMVRPLG